MTAHTPEHPQIANPWPAMWSLVVGFFMILVDSTIVTVAMPAIMKGLNTGIAGAMWVTSAYLLAYAVPLLVTGRLGDRFGPKKVYLAGLVLFTAASAWCGFATTIEALIIARVLQGLGGALISPQTMSVITRIFPPDKRGAAMGIWGAVAGIASLVGPILGGVLVDTLGWEWIFFVNLPIGVVAFWVAWKNVPALPVNEHRFDWLGVVLSGVALFCIVFGLEEGTTFDWGQIVGPISVWGLIISGVILMGVFLLWQWRNRGEPLIPLGLFSDRNFSVANVSIAMMGLVITSQVFPIMLYTQTVRGLSPTQAALLTLPTAVLSGVLAPLVGRRLNLHDPRKYAIAGFVLMVAGLIGYSMLMRPGVSVLWLLAPAAVVGVANTGIWGPLSVSATRNLPPHRAGAGSGIYNTTRQLGSVLGSAAIATLMQQRLASNLPATGGQTAPTMGGGQVPPFLEAGFSAALAQSMWLPVAAATLALVAASLLESRKRAATSTA